MICPICYEAPIIRESSLIPKGCDHEGTCQKCQDSWKATCFERKTNATCVLCRKPVATDWSPLVKKMEETQKILKALIGDSK